MSDNRRYTSAKTRKAITDILDDQSASYWLKDALKSALSRDCLDAKYDAKILADTLKLVCDDIFNNHKN